MASINTPVGVGISAEVKEIVIVAGAGVGLLLLLYYVAKHEVSAAAGAVADAAKTAATTTAKAVDTVANGLNAAGNGIVKNTIAATLPSEKADSVIGWWDSWSIGTKIYDLTHYESPKG